ncbi:hypothetical protein P2318_33740 [Myxococcaceae bacterium GXIMD 01537]
MNLLRPCLGGLLGLGLLLAPDSSQAAAGVRLNIGADYWLEHSAAFNLTLGVDADVVGPIAIGARFGALLVTEPNTFGVPLDIILRANVADRRVYIEAMAGPWVFFEGDALRTHAAFGFGVQGRRVSLGIEVGYLEPEPVIGLRLGYRF